MFDLIGFYKTIYLLALIREIIQSYLWSRGWDITFQV